MLPKSLYEKTLVQVEEAIQVISAEMSAQFMLRMEFWLQQVKQGARIFANKISFSSQSVMSDLARRDLASDLLLYEKNFNLEFDTIHNTVRGEFTWMTGEQSWSTENVIYAKNTTSAQRVLPQEILKMQDLIDLVMVRNLYSRSDFDQTVDLFMARNKLKALQELQASLPDPVNLPEPASIQLNLDPGGGLIYDKSGISVNVDGVYEFEGEATDAD